MGLTSVVEFMRNRGVNVTNVVKLRPEVLGFDIGSMHRIVTLLKEHGIDAVTVFDRDARVFCKAGTVNREGKRERERALDE